MDNFEKYRKASVESLVSDIEFIKWVKLPNNRSNQFWKRFLDLHPEQKENVDMARQLVQDMKVAHAKADPGNKTQLWNKIERNLDLATSKRASVYKMKYWMAAASAVLILFLGYFVISNNSSKNEFLADAGQKPAVISPGGNKATLTLADGSTIVLDSANTGAISRQGNVTVIKLNDGELSYQTSGMKADENLNYNTISTPRGGQYQLILSDGSKVWLNAESSLRFPAVFGLKERRVELTGEGYFEVAHNDSKPFYVSAGEMDIRVLGTHFNVNGYKEEGSIKTTLLEGSVMVSTAGKEVTLKPGQQAVFASENGLQTFNNLDLEQIVAWKNGYFSFQDAGLKEVMHQIERWYDVDVKYEGEVSSRKFGGGISRDANLDDVLKILQRSRVNFKVNGRTIVVTQ